MAILVALAVVAMGIGLFLIGSALPAGGARTLGPNRPVNPGATDPTDLGAHNSPTLARNPTDAANLAVANRIDAPAFSCALHVSADAGTSWTDTPVPFPSGEELPERCFAPDIAFGPDGTLYYSFVTLAGAGNRPNAVWVASSTDGGRTLSTPSRAAGPLAFQVRLVADPSRPGRIWLSWLQAEATANLAFPVPGNPVVVSSSDDGGITWGDPVEASSPSRERVVAPSVALGPGGELLLLYLDLGDDSLDYHGGHEGRGGPPYPGLWSLVLARSTDEGATWDETVVDPALVPTNRVIVFFPQSPSLAVDPERSKVFVAFQDGRWGDADVAVWASDDGGATFGAPVRVNDTPEGDGTSQYLPRLAVAPGGRLDVVYYDRRLDPDNAMNEVSLQTSTDGGRSFGPRLRVSDRAFDSRIGFGSERGLADLGSRLGLVSGDAGTVAVWSDTRAGNPVSGKQDLALAVVTVDEAAPLRAPLLVTGAAVVVAGLLGGLWWAVRSRRETGQETEMSDGRVSHEHT